MSYESPIKLTNTMESIVRRVREEGDKKIYECIANYGIDVNKEELEKALRYDRDQYVKGYKDGKAEAMQWIPCSERLPEDGQTVLIQYEDRRNERKSMAVGWMGNDYLCCWDDRITHAIDNAVAWMPLPEPYKEGVKE